MIYEHIWADIKVKNTAFAIHFINTLYKPPSTLAEDEAFFLLTSGQILTNLSDQQNPVIASELNFGNRAPDFFENYRPHQLI